jgi:hypothetical protein
MLQITWGQPLGSGRVVHSFVYWADVTDVKASPTPDLAARLLCHLLVDFLPENSLHEARTALLSMWEYYRDLQPLQLESGGLAAEPAVLAKYGESYDSPPFEIVEG